MALSPQFLDELRARTPLAALIGRKVKLTKSGRNWKGCCPFHSEKTASFYVYEDQFHCFGCGAHGDAISFWMQSNGSSFPEAVESLASEAGLEVPKASPAQAHAEQRRLDLHEVLDCAQASFVRRLHASEGAPALAYLRRRGLDDQTIARFGLGWSGDGRGGLTAELREAGIDADRAFEAGLLREAEDGSRRELYWGRVTFPIRDRRGRLISFGGRALGDAKPKYINGPDTPIFPKRRTLYALDIAREAVRAGKPLVVAEGYMDVIALHQAGFTGAVAPLGTALTDDHLAELWRLSPEPLLCFDGDAAGAKAAERAIMLAMPLLQPGYSLKIATLPAGQDPDSLVQSAGPKAFAAVLDAANPLVDALFAALAQGIGAEPEQRAALRTRLDALAAAIPDRTLAAEFRTALRDRFFASRKRGKPTPPRPVRRVIEPNAADAERANILVAILLRHPGSLPTVREAFENLELPSELDRLRDEILNHDDDPQLDSATLLAHLKQSGTAEQAASVLAATMSSSVRTRSKTIQVEAVTEWWHIYGLMHRSRLEDEITSARRALTVVTDETSQRRLTALCAALAALDDPDEGAS